MGEMKVTTGINTKGVTKGEVFVEVMFATGVDFTVAVAVNLAADQCSVFIGNIVLVVGPHTMNA